MTEKNINLSLFMDTISLKAQKSTADSRGVTSLTEKAEREREGQREREMKGFLS